MVAFTAAGKLKRYLSAEEILQEYYPLRLALYGARKAYLLQKLLREHEILVNKVAFIRLVISDTLVIRKVKKAVILQKLVGHGLKTWTVLKAILKENPAALAAERERREQRAAAGEEEAKEDPEGDDEAEGGISAGDYDYLLGMPLWALSEERVAALEREMEEKRLERAALTAKTLNDLWEEDLQDFLAALDIQEAEDEKNRLAGAGSAAENGGKRKKAAAGAGKKGKGKGKKGIPEAKNVEKKQAKAA
jgi:DNA topoisomerase-2